MRPPKERERWRRVALGSLVPKGHCARAPSGSSSFSQQTRGAPYRICRFGLSKLAVDSTRLSSQEHGARWLLVVGARPLHCEIREMQHKHEDMKLGDSVLCQAHAVFSSDMGLVATLRSSDAAPCLTVSISFTRISIVQVRKPHRPMGFLVGGTYMSFALIEAFIQTNDLRIENPPDRGDDARPTFLSALILSTGISARNQSS